MLLVLLFWIGLAGTQQVQHHSSTGTDRRVEPCFVDDAVAALREALQTDGALSNRSLTLFGACRAPDPSSRSTLLVLSEERRRWPDGGLKVRQPAAVFATEERGVVTLTFDLPASSLLEMNLLLLLLAFESPAAAGDLEVTFSSRFLLPHSQSACISEGTLYVLLMGRSSSSSSQHRWTISAEQKSPRMNQNLIDAIIGGKPGGPVGVTPLLLFTGEEGINGSRPAAFGSSGVPVQTSFVCELRRFLEGVLPQDQDKQPLLQLDSLQALPPLPLGLSSSETLLAALINSSAPTIFYFNNWGSKSQGLRGQLILSPALLVELRLRLEQSEMLILDLAEQETVSPRTTARLERLKDLSASQQMEAAESHFCAFLLLKALKTVAHAYDMTRRLRSTRAGPDSPPKGNICGLRSLTVSFEKLLLGPQSANINNCRGVCSFPLINGNNHAILLTSHTESVAEERAPCCVPVAYDPLEVLDWNDEGSFLSIKPDMIARECGCR
uniref:Mullerian inhibiting substance homologue n=1 Tax=Oryzias latipes TaxID=8090 RepID=Q08M17_ORYLA|nr:mullerian inhibiting substance homologue [Oryzias latipes]